MNCLNNTNNTTIVSAFMMNVLKDEEIMVRMARYIQSCIPLLEAKIHKIIFIDDTIADTYKMYNNAYTKIIPFKRSDNYLYEHEKEITDFNLNTHNLKKDTIGYMFTMAHKTEWVKQAIKINEDNDINYSQYMWIDFGVAHMCKCSPSIFKKTIESFNNKKYNNVRISSIWDVNSNYSFNIYKDITWFFAGSIFGGNKDALIEFANRMREKTLEIIKTKNTIMWEVNIWYLVYLENKALFDLYNCDHNDLIIQNY